MKLYALGSNGSGQLGLGHKEDVSEPQECIIVTKPNAQPPGTPTRIVGSGNTTYILFDSGSIYQAGLNYWNLGESNQSILHLTNPIFEETAFSRKNKAKLCSTSWDAWGIASEHNEIYVCGKGAKGELGLDQITSAENATKLGEFPPPGSAVVDLAGSMGHTVVVLANGEAYGWGNGRKGQLGEPADIVKSPRKISGLGFKVVRAACGKDFTFLVGEPSESLCVVLGSDKWGIKSQAPTNIRGWKDIGASWGSIFVLEDSGKIKSWGRNDRGQLTPAGLPLVKKMAVGSEHVLALTDRGETGSDTICWGWGEHGNCGEKTDQDGDVKGGRWNTITIAKEDYQSNEVIGIGAGCATSFIWTRT